MSETNFSRPVPVVRLIIPDASGRALILRRAGGTTAGGYWCLPGGKVDYGDTVEQAAARELEEETGLHAAGMRFLFYQDSLPPSPGTMHCINLYLECIVEGKLALTMNPWKQNGSVRTICLISRSHSGTMRGLSDIGRSMGDDRSPSDHWDSNCCLKDHAPFASAANRRRICLSAVTRRIRHGRKRKTDSQ